MAIRDKSKVLSREWCKTTMIGICLFALSYVVPTIAQAQYPAECGNPFQNHFGPFDYRNATLEEKRMVEGAHFTPGVESLTRPSKTTYGTMAGDVGYTLHVFPNHHRALISMMRLGDRHKTDKPPGARYTVECYLERAVRFRPDDTIALSLYAQYLGKKNRKPEALHKLQLAIIAAGDNPMSLHTIGTVYLELGEFDLALAQAHKARALGLEWPYLEDALKAAGHWRASQ